MRWFITVTAAVAMLIGQALADDVFTRAVYCTAIMKGQIGSARRAFSELAANRTLNENQRKEAIRIGQQVERKYTTDLNRLYTYVLTNTRLDDPQQGMAVAAGYESR
jgi:hypothetical protein